MHNGAPDQRARFLARLRPVAGYALSSLHITSGNSISARGFFQKNVKTTFESGLTRHKQHADMFFQSSRENKPSSSKTKSESVSKKFESPKKSLGQIPFAFA